MTAFYTNFIAMGNKVLVRGYDNGQQFKRRIRYKPTLYLPAPGKSDWQTLYGRYVEPMAFESMREAKDFVKQYKEVENFEIFGSTEWAYNYINEAYSGTIDWARDLLRVVDLDIETTAHNGFPYPHICNDMVNAITIGYQDRYMTWGLGEYETQHKDERYVQCKDERELLARFLDVWEKIQADIVTGWNIEFFDIPYLVNRITKILGETAANRLSPWKIIWDRTVKNRFGEQIAFDLVGIAILDYMQLYKKFRLIPQESYSLDHICHFELKEKKLDYSEYDNLTALAKENHQLFIEYNIKDVRLIRRLDDKLKMIDMVLALSYITKVNYNDAFTQLRMWDTIINNRLLDKKIVVPSKKAFMKRQAYEGAYVKDPKVGMHNWVVSFDLTSLYPHLMMQYNISPEMLVETECSDLRTEDILNGATNTTEWALAGNGHYFRRDRQGILPEIVEGMFTERNRYKNKMLAAQKEKEQSTDPDVRSVIDAKISKFNILQGTFKVVLNSCYGAIGAPWFRFFDVRTAEAVTLSGQLSIKWVEKAINEYLNNMMKSDDVDYCIYMDTDSVYVSLDALIRRVFKDQSDKGLIVDFIDEVICPKIDGEIEAAYEKLAKTMNAYQQKMFMKREVIADRGIWSSKKRYILNVHDSEGVRYAEPKMKIMGLETARSSTPNTCREALKKAFGILINEDQQALHNFIDEYKAEFMAAPLIDIAFPRGVNGLSKYKGSFESIYLKGTPMHVKGALTFNWALKEKGVEKTYDEIKEGEKIKFLHLREPNPFGVNVIAFINVLPPEFGIEGYVDKAQQFEKAFLGPLTHILECIGWTAEKISTLEDFWE
tara:strand:- start:93 stop:2585 length:2493 start_codon:yes stop_codon:yes gene_type:complete